MQSQIGVTIETSYFTSVQLLPYGFAHLSCTVQVPNSAIAHFSSNQLLSFAFPNPWRI